MSVKTCDENCFSCQYPDCILGNAVTSNEKVRRAEYARARYAEHKEEILASRRQWAKDNPEKIREYSRRYYKENREKCVEYSKRYYQANREKILAAQKQYRMNEYAMKKRAEYIKRYREEHRDEIRDYMKKYRESRKTGNGGENVQKLG